MARAASKSATASLDARLQYWWDTFATQTFAHRDYRQFGGSVALHKTNRQLWLDRFCADGRCNETRVTEYGIGAGLLGEQMMKTYNLSHYDGIDISQKSLDAARARLLQHGCRAERFGLHNVSVDFASLAPKLFITQAVIQHFPSLNYTFDFLDRVNRCGAQYLMLQTRNGTIEMDKETVGTRGGRWPEWRVRHATRVTTPQLEGALDKYLLEWHVVGGNANIYYAFRRKRVPITAYRWRDRGDLRRTL